MIRIDLSQDVLQKKSAPAGPAILNKLPKGLQTFTKGRGKGGSKRLDPVALIVLGLAFAASFLPSLFVGQYEKYIEREREVQLKMVQERIALVNQEISKLTPYQKELESYEVQKKLVKERLDVIRQLVTSRGTPVSILDAIGQSVPSRTWLNAIDFTVKNGVPLVTMNGQSLANEEISDLVDKLSESVYFNEVVLEQVSSAKVENTYEAKTFNIVAHPKFRVPSAQAIKASIPAPAGVPAPQAGKAANAELLK